MTRRDTARLRGTCRLPEREFSAKNRARNRKQFTLGEVTLGDAMVGEATPGCPTDARRWAARARRPAATVRPPNASNWQD
ncbi:hypothetical protein [Mycolicibacterium poriferae]|uniref:hypothetical protein n=1 Tax=Mycolicibacterium poriferae TaxID=39694 RepID=UPI0024B8EF0C|nr:hypothetical protein [Mycolicibacterium poriferae]